MMTPLEAVKIQEILRDMVVGEDQFGEIRRVAGTDVGFSGKIANAAAVVLNFPELSVEDSAHVKAPVSFPYIPGLLSFREAPFAIKALKKLKTAPELILCDGHGIAHPRRFGIACHIGLLLDIPTIGVAKSRLIGSHDDVANTKGAFEYLKDKKEIIGAVLRTRQNVSPVYVSIGHKICLESAVRYVMECVTKYRLPETTRHAHRMASEQ